MSAGVDAITLAWGVAALLFFLSLWPSNGMLGRNRYYAAAAGIVLLSAAAIYDMDIVNMPEILAVLVIGTAAGWLPGREWPRNQLIALMTVLAGLAGLAMLCAASAAWLNPYAFGLVDEGSDVVAARYALMLALSALTGGSACAGVLVLAIRRRAAGTGLLALSAAMAGWSAAAMAFLLQNAGMAIAGGLAGAAGTGIALRICGGALRKGLADGEPRP